MKPEIEMPTMIPSAEERADTILANFRNHYHEEPIVLGQALTDAFRDGIQAERARCAEIAHRTTKARQALDNKILQQDEERGRPLTETEKIRNLFRAIYSDELKEAAKRERERIIKVIRDDRRLAAALYPLHPFSGRSIADKMLDALADWLESDGDNETSK